MDTWIQVVITVFIALITFVLGWLANKKLADGTFLRKEVYSPLHEEVSTMHANVSDFKKCHHRRSGHPDYSAAPPANRVPGNIRRSLIDNGQYFMLPEDLKKAMDEYYLKCIEEWDEHIDILNAVHDLQTGKLVEVQVHDESKSVTMKYSNGQAASLSTLDGKNVYQKYRGIEKLSENEIRTNLAPLQLWLQNRGTYLLRQLEQRIRNPKPLKSLLSHKD
jgi:hypothetical protein